MSQIMQYLNNRLAKAKSDNGRAYWQEVINGDHPSRVAKLEKQLASGKISVADDAGTLVRSNRAKKASKTRKANKKEPVAKATPKITVKELDISKLKSAKLMAQAILALGYNPTSKKQVNRAIYALGLQDAPFYANNKLKKGKKNNAGHRIFAQFA